MDETTNSTPNGPGPDESGASARPRRRFGAATLVLAMIAAAGLAGGGALYLSHRMHAGAAAPEAAAKTQYQCPMHPTIVSDHPADCPICGMKLVKVASAAAAPESGKTGGQAQQQYICPMHPTIVSDHPDNCPICGMKLVKSDAGGGSSGVSGQAAAKTQYQCPMHPNIVQDQPGNCPICGMKLVKMQSAAPAPEQGVPGLAAVDIDPARQQLIGLTTVEAKQGKVGGAWRTVGRVAVDETRVRHINVKVPGFVERIYVDFIGKPVKKGDPLFSLYSPELLAAQEEYLLALRTRASLEKAGGAAADGDALVAAARRKLALWDVPASALERIERTGETTRTLTFHSPVSGVVTKKDVVEGMKLDAGAMPYELVDLTQVWVLADVYESELRFVRAGMPATLTLAAYPGREFKGKVAFVDPMLDPQTRTVKLRISFPNQGGMLRPEMFGEVVLHGPSREGLSIPADAVIDSGREKVVFVAVGEGRFQPRPIRVGESDGTTVEVVEGLAAGERVVTRANFLVDSESRLRASLAELSAGAQPAKPDSARVLPGGKEEAKPPQNDAAPAAPAPGGDGARDGGSQGRGGQGGHGGHGAHKS